MRRIVGVLRPFDKFQAFYVYENGNKLEATQTTTIDNINEIIFALCQKYGITQVDLTGPKQFNRGLKKKFEIEEIKRYNEHKITINII